MCGRDPALRPHPSQAEFTSTPNRVWKCEDLAVFRQEYDQDMGLWEELEASPPFVHKTLPFICPSCLSTYCVLQVLARGVCTYEGPLK